MNRFIKTFYLWLGVISIGNALSFAADLLSGRIAEKGWLLYPAAWLLQLPIVFILTLAHHLFNTLVSRLPPKGARQALWITAAAIVFIVSGVYATSQMMREELNSFLSWDMLKVAVADTRQILPDIARNNGRELTLLLLFSVGSGLAFTRRYHNPKVQHSTKVFAVSLAVLLCFAASSFAFAFGSEKRAAMNLRSKTLPTTYLVASFVDDMIINRIPGAGTIKDLNLLPRISMDRYLESARPAAEPHVIFIMLEAVTWDHYGFTGYPRQDITPNLDALARQSMIFPRTYAAANHSNYSQTSTHSSVYPLRQNHLDQFETVNYPKTLLFDILGAAGYQTAFISAQNEDWQGMRKFIFADDAHLQYFFHSKDFLGQNIGIESKIDDRIVCNQAIDWLDRRTPGRPVFLYVNFQRTHFPYDIPEEAPHPYEPCSTDGFDFKFFGYDRDHIDEVVNKFDNALHYVDQQVGALIDYLKQNGLYENSLIVVASDHGEAFYKHGYPTHSTSLFDDQIRVAALIKQPGQASSVLRNDAISLIDINPTILEVLGMPNHPNFQGRPVLKQPRGGYIYIMSHGIVKALGIVDYPWKYIASSRDGARLVNLDSHPDESNDLSEQYPDKLEELQNALGDFYRKQLYYYQAIPQEERDEFYPPHL